MRTAVAIIILLLILVGIGYLADSGEQSTTFFKNGDDSESSDEVSLLILGRVAEGQGGQWHAAPNLTDAIIIAQYLPERNRINLISLPRDLYGEFGGSEFKINEIYSRKKIGEFMEKLPEITGVEVENYLVVDVDTIKAAVDSLGGVDVALEEAVTDPVSGFKLEPGLHHLDGESVIWIMRNRFAPGGDFFREKNQHNIIASIFDAFNSLSSVEKTRFLLSMVPYAQGTETNFSVGELAPRLGDINEISFNSVTLDFSTGLLVSSYVVIGTTTVVTEVKNLATSTQQSSSTEDPSGQAGQSTATSLRAYVLIPREGINNYNAIREYIETKLQ
ncbi:MAG: Cell envelope-like protein function transcriptional attenuator common domain protein [Parcubacteria group bacterium GW2011_GWB1_45_7]|nr:MAG: Cell envelope-like protein function transcriptional attenuator common domain protein [Parcubacteria group bacterium GW2011_GWB1_45_7]